MLWACHILNRAFHLQNQSAARFSIIDNNVELGGQCPISYMRRKALYPYCFRSLAHSCFASKVHAYHGFRNNGLASSACAANALYKMKVAKKLCAGRVPGRSNHI